MIACKSKNALLCIILDLALALTACSKLPQSPKTETAKPQPTQPSEISVDIKPGGPAIFTTSAAEFQVTPDGYVQAFLFADARKKDGTKLSLDEPNVGSPSESNFVRVGNKDVHFTLDFQRAQVHEAVGKMGAGKRVEIPARPLGSSGTDLQLTLALEVYDQFPNILLSSVEYKNEGSTEVVIEKSVNQRRRLNP